MVMATLPVLVNRSPLTYKDNSANDTDAAVGTITFDVTVPATAITTNPTFARFRWSTTQNLNSTAAANDGEVEDYQVTLQDSNPDIRGDLCQTSSDMMFILDRSGSVNGTERGQQRDAVLAMLDHLIANNIPARVAIV